MVKRARQLLNAAIAPVLTVVCTWLAADWLDVGADQQKALGATAAGLLARTYEHVPEVLDDRPVRRRPS